MSNHSWHLLTFCFFAALVFFAKLPILDVPHYWDEMDWVSQAHWLSQVNLLRALPGLRPPDAFWGHPPGLHLTLASFAKIFGYSIVLSHLIAVCFAFIGVWSTFLLGRLLYNAKTGVFAALLLFLSPIYFAQSGMFLGDLPVASLGIMSLYFALRSRYLAYLLCATYMVFLKETSVALLVALLLYLVLRNRPKTKEDLICVVRYSVPLLAIGFFFLWQKITTGHFFFIYPQDFDVSLFVDYGSVFHQFVLINKWIFVYQHRYIFSALIVLNLVINKASRRRAEFGLFFLICVLSGYSFSVLYFLPRYLMPVLPYLYLLGAWSLMELVKPAALKTPAAAATLVAMIWSLATQPFVGSSEFNLRYLDAVKVHKEMCEFIESAFPDSRILTAFPHIRALQWPHVGYVKQSLSVASLADKQAPRDADLILVSAPLTHGMEQLKRYAVKNDWRLIRRLRKEPVITELYGRPE